jgi:hypothetical protein
MVNPNDMQVQFSVKQLGKKRPFIDAKRIEIVGEYGVPCLLRELLERVVVQQVGEFNERRAEKSLFTFFQENEIAQEAETGKVRFGAIYNDTQANVAKAIETVLLAFQDGLIAVFIDDNQVEKLDSEVVLHENTVITLVRLTFLVGSAC